MSKIFYLAGGFNFTYEQFNKDSSVISSDYRAHVFECFGVPYTKLFGKSEDGHYFSFVRLNSNAYVGPFYYYAQQNYATEQSCVVGTENKKVQEATDVVFFIDGSNAPGTVTEMINASLLSKQVHIYYTENFDNSVSGDINSTYWYPIVFANTVNKDNTHMHVVKDFSEFEKELIKLIEK